MSRTPVKGRNVASESNRQERLDAVSHGLAELRGYL
jgi:hypothetical protein